MIPLIAETWLWWSLVVLVFFCRFVSRILHQGSIKNLQFDDWLMWFAIACYTTTIVTLNIESTVSSNLFPPGFDYSTLTESDIKAREYGSKVTLVVEICQCFTVWTAKACILIMYMRLTQGRPEHFWVKCLAIYTGASFVLMEILYLGVWCAPFHNYWAVPTPNIQCSAAIHHLITNAVFNLSSDAVLLIIALPMFIRTQMPVRKKAALCAVFGLGIFVMISAILNKYYSFTNPFGTAWTYWYCRESSTSMLVANLPFVYTLFRRLFKLRSLDSTDQYGTRSKSKGTKLTTFKQSKMGTLMSHNRGDDEKGLMGHGVFSSTATCSGPEAHETSSIEGIKKEVGVTFLSTPAWMEDFKGNTVTVTAGEVNLPVAPPQAYSGEQKNNEARRSTGSPPSPH